MTTGRSRPAYPPGRPHPPGAHTYETRPGGRPLADSIESERDGCNRQRPTCASPCTSTPHRTPRRPGSPPTSSASTPTASALGRRAVRRAWSSGRSSRTDLTDLRSHTRAWDLLRRTRMPRGPRGKVGYVTNPGDAERLADPGSATSSPRRSWPPCSGCTSPPTRTRTPACSGSTRSERSRGLDDRSPTGPTNEADGSSGLRAWEVRAARQRRTGAGYRAEELAQAPARPPPAR